MTQALKAGSSNARTEGYVPTYAAANQTVRERQDNQVQLLSLPFSVSGTQNAVNKAGLGQASEYDYQKSLKYKELALDTDYEMINNDKVTRDADAGTAGEMNGILAFATGNRAVAAGGNLLTEDVYNGLAQIISENGEDADTVFCSGFQKRAITGWTTGIRRLTDGEGTYKNSIMKYDGDWGVQEVIHDKHIASDTIAVMNVGYVKAAYLRPVAHTELGTLGDKQLGLVLTEVTLEVQAPTTVGKITGLATVA